MQSGGRRPMKHLSGAWLRPEMHDELFSIFKCRKNFAEFFKNIFDLFEIVRVKLPVFVIR